MLYLRVIFVVFLVSGCSAKPYFTEPSEPYSATGDLKVYIVSHGWHTGIVVPYKAITTTLPDLTDRFPIASYIEFGWGDKGFYQSQEITTGLTLRTIFLPTESVVHAVAIPGSVGRYFWNSEISTLYLTDAELSSLTKFISGSFARDESDKLISTKQGIYGDSQFYKGVGEYYLFNTCNKWTAKGLKSIGLDVSTTFKLTAGSVMDYLNSIDSISR